ncbi:splicing factor 3B subunit 3-like [Guaruba guarouba]
MLYADDFQVLLSDLDHLLRDHRSNIHALHTQQKDVRDSVPEVILALEKLGAVFNQVAFPLQYTSRKFVIHPESNNAIITETDRNAYTEATKAQRKQQMAEEMVEAAGEDERELAAEMAAAFLNENLPESIFGSPKAGNGQWASVIRVMNPIQGNTLDLVQLEQNEAAFSVAVCRFSMLRAGPTVAAQARAWRPEEVRL